MCLSYLAKDIGAVAVDKPVAGDHGVPGHLLLLHAEVCAGVLHEHVVLHKTAGVQQNIDSLSGRQLSLLMLGLNPFLATYTYVTG